MLPPEPQPGTVARTREAREPKLTVAIPTFNRNHLLLENLPGLLAQLTPECRLLVLDNASDVPVAETLEPLLSRYPRVDARVVRHRTNIGGNANILRCFELCETEWLWVLGDDEEVKPDAVAVMLHHARTHPECVLFNFAVEGWTNTELTLTRGDREFLERLPAFGNVLFISTNLYRAPALLPYLKLGYQYAYSMAPHFVLVFRALGDSGVCCFSPEKVVSFVPTPAEEQWSVIDVALGFPTLLDQPLSADLRRLLERRVFKAPDSLPLQQLWLQLVLHTRKDGDVRSALYYYDKICRAWYTRGAGLGRRAQVLLGRMMLRFPRVGYWGAQLVQERIRGRALPPLQDRTRRL